MVVGLLPVPLEASLELPHDQVIEGRGSNTIETFVAKLNAIDG